MKHLYKSFLLFFILFTSISSFSQTPQYYNYNTGGATNSFPFGIPAGKQVQLLVLPGDLNQPTPAPAGNITKVYFRMIANFGPFDYTNVVIKMGQDPSLTTFATGVWYTGPLTTVYSRASVSLGAVSGDWLTFTLDAPFAYNPAQSLIVDIQQCSNTGTANTFATATTTLSGFRRNTSLTTSACPFAWGQQSGSMHHMGVDVSVVPMPLFCIKFAGSWCPIGTYPTLPAATYFHAAAWIGDTMYVQAPSTAGAGATTVYRYVHGSGWTTGVPCLVGVSAASMNAVGGKLYLIGGGATATTGTTNVQRYDPATGVWTAMAPLPVALSAHGSVNWGDSVIYVVGGPYTGAATNLAVHYYRVGSNTWGTIANSLPSGQGRRTFALSMADGKIVMTCGFNTVYLKTTFVGTPGANASLLTWAPGADAPIALSRPAGVGYDTYSFLVGGDTNTTAVKNDKVFRYNVNGNVWKTAILSNPSAVSNMMNAVTIKCINDTVRIFQPGGYTTVAVNPLVITGCGTITGTGNPISTIPGTYSLSQNYPNPFNPSTRIEFALPKGEFVEIRLYDILGKEVAILANGNYNAGNHTLDLNLSYLSSGSYFYRINAGQFTDTKKLMLMK